MLPPCTFRSWQNSKSVPWPEWQLLKDWIACDCLQPRWDMWCKVFLTLLPKIKKWVWTTQQRKSNYSFLREKVPSENYQKMVQEVDELCSIFLSQQSYYYIYVHKQKSLWWLQNNPDNVTQFSTTGDQSTYSLERQKHSSPCHTVKYTGGSVKQNPPQNQLSSTWIFCPYRREPKWP